MPTTPVKLKIIFVETAILSVDLPTNLVKLQKLCIETVIARSTGSIAMPCGRTAICTDRDRDRSLYR